MVVTDKMLYRASDYFWIPIVSVLIVAVPFFIWFGLDPNNTFNINIEKYYYEDWQECEDELERTIPKCPACECKTEGSFVLYFIWFFLGIWWGFIIKSWRDDWKKSQKKSKPKVRRKK